MSKNKTTRPTHALDNRSNQLNPQHPEFYQAAASIHHWQNASLSTGENQGHSLTSSAVNPRKTHNPSK